MNRKKLLAILTVLLLVFSMECGLPEADRASSVMPTAGASDLLSANALDDGEPLEALY